MRIDIPLSSQPEVYLTFELRGPCSNLSSPFASPCLTPATTVPHPNSSPSIYPHLTNIADYYDRHDSRHSSPIPAPVGLPPSARVNPAYSVEEVFIRNGKQDSHHLRARAYRDGIERHRGRSLSSSAPRRIDQGRCFRPSFSHPFYFF